MQIIRVAGSDAREFLHRQLTQDVIALDAGRGTLAAWLDAKGRVLALFEIAQVHDAWLLATAADIASGIRTRLARYVLRADVSIDIDEEAGVFAVVGPSTDWLAGRGIDLGAAPYAASRDGECVWLRLGPELVHALGPRAALEPALEQLEAVEAEAAARAEIALGLPLIGAALSERYVPQMLCLEALGAVSFDKGCYPGQEIVARTHNLGTIKRRLARLRSVGGAPPAVGTVLTDAASEPAGEVVRAATVDEGAELLAVVRVEALPGPLYISGDDRRPVERLALPYD